MSRPKTLFDFFSKSPATKSPPGNVTNSPANNKSSISTPKSVSTSKSVPSPKNVSTPKNISTPKGVSNSKSIRRKLKRQTSDSDNSPNKSESEEEKETVVNKKRRRIVIASESDDSEDDYKPGKDSATEDSDSMQSNVSSDAETPKKKRKKASMKSISSPSLSSFINPKVSLSKSSPNTPLSALKTNGTDKNKKSAASPCGLKMGKQSTPNNSIENGGSRDIAESTGTSEDSVKEWLHENLDFLKDEKIKDKYGRFKSDPNYDRRTLYVPESFKKNLTPAMKQWWDMKINHFDVILFFKVGKFYELYHMDAVVGVKELGLVYMKGEFAHSGFPEIAYGRYSDCLVERGYKVARVEQTETPAMMEDRCKNMSRPTKYDKVVMREICQITSKGTRTLTYQEEPLAASHHFLLTLSEKCLSETDNETEYGICFVDTTIGKFYLGQFKDDRHGSRIMTLIALYPPVEILYEKSSVSKKTLHLLNTHLSCVPKEGLSSGSQFWDSTKILKFLSEENFFSKGTYVEWPEAIKKMLDEDDRLHQTPLKEYELAIKALGGCVWYLKECCIEDNLLSMKLFEEYKPADGTRSLITSSKSFANQHMVLDGVTLRNLEVVPLRSSDSIEGTLLGTMNNCATSFGARLFRHWLCSPLCNPDSIADRLDAIDDLFEIPDVVAVAVSQLKNIPDLERLLSKIHTQGLVRSKSHADTRAIFYDADIYNKKKLHEFFSTLDGFKESMKIIEPFKEHADNFKSSLLKSCVCSKKERGIFPDMSEALDYFENAFDHKLAKKEGNIVPSQGVDSDYDSAISELKEVESDLDSYLEKLRSKFNCKVSYVGSGKTRFQVEIPDTKKVPEHFEFQGARKGFKRFYTSETREYVARVIAAEESRDAALRDVTRRIFAQFDKDYNMWKAAIHCLSTLDVLISLLTYRKSSEVTMCRPQYSLPDEETEPFLEIYNGMHPTFLKYFTGDSYIPNNVYIGPKRDTDDNINDGGRLILVTGPNMGGKSTFMRQAGTLLIMAHVGSYVPAVSMKLTPVDRIFTRVGASDQISKGESTFFVEASETSSILHHATSNSFVLIDELGRGTSTHDGTAIAYSVVDYIANEICCRTLFSTHYHSLVEDFCTYPTVGLGHMACMVEKDTDCPALERITFLYKFINGFCPKSYGFNVALLAGISKDIVRRGFLKAQEMECHSSISKSLRKLKSVLKSEDILQEVNKKLQVLKMNQSVK